MKELQQRSDRRGADRNTRGRVCSPAFSIMELLVAVSIMTFIVYALYQMFYQTQKALRGNITQVDVLESGRAVSDMIGRELEQLSASGLGGHPNLYVGLITDAPATRQLDLNEKEYLRTNVLQEVFFLSRRTNTWVATGYYITNCWERNGVGSLYRFSASTKYQSITSRKLFEEYKSFKAQITRNSPRVVDGIVHFRLLAFDRLGQRMRVGTTNYVNVSLTVDSAKFLSERDLTGETKLIFLSNAVPAYIELEFGVLEDRTLAQYKSMTADSPVPSVAAYRFLQNQASKVHLFRQRIPVRTAWQ